jgi:hypothetical protein
LWRKPLQRIDRPLEMKMETAETASRRQSAAMRAWSTMGSADVFTGGGELIMAKRVARRAGLARHRPFPSKQQLMHPAAGCRRGLGAVDPPPPPSSLKA